ncbi:MAG: MATE family efflux transporter [Clostridia bacterium]|nr:MATE family efflux transporter [Clostridia bacterium]
MTKILNIIKAPFKIFSKDVDMLEGKITPSIIVYLIPLIFTNLLQSLFNAVDITMLGNLAGSQSVAEVSATGTIIGLLVQTVISTSVGTSIVLSYSMGANDAQRTQKIIKVSYTFSLILGVLVAVLGLLLSKPMLRATSCPDSVIDGSANYMRIYFLGAPAMLFYNFMSHVLRVSGDSRRPFIYLTVAGVTNVVLNFIFVKFFALNTVGVALATTISNYLSAILLFIRLLKIKGELKISPTAFSLDGNTLKKIVTLGIPAGISSAAFSIPNLMITSAVNGFGPSAISGNGAQGIVNNLLIFAISGAFGVATAAFVGKNIGAGNRERVGKLIRSFMLLALSVLAVITVLGLIFAKEIIAIVIPDDPAGIEFGAMTNRYIMSVAVLSGVMNVSGGIMQAFGKTGINMTVNLICTCGLRFVWMLLIYPLMPTADMLYVCFTITWIVCAIVDIAVILTLWHKYKSNKILAG